MEPSVINTEPKQNRRIILKIVVTVAVLAALAGLTVLIVNIVHHNNLVNEVKTELIKQNKLIKSAAKNNVYSNEVPNGVKSTNTVNISVEISASGTDYCIAGTNKQDAKLVYHMSKATPEDAPADGSCSENVTTVPLAPTGFVLGSVGAGAISLSWNSAPFAASYTVQCATDKDFLSGLVSQITNNTQITFANLTGGSQYYCRVSAINNVGSSLWSMTVLALTNSISIAPTNVTFSTVSSSDLHYSWTPVSGAQYYIVQWATDDDFLKDVVTVTTTNTSGDATNLQTYTGYYVHAKAITAQFGPDKAAWSDEILGRTSK